MLTSARQDPELDLAGSSSHHVRRGAGEGPIPKLAPLSWRPRLPYEALQEHTGCISGTAPIAAS